MVGHQRGQGHDYDARANIDCREGPQCEYSHQGACRYRHSHTRKPIRLELTEPGKKGEVYPLLKLIEIKHKKTDH